MLTRRTQLICICDCMVFSDVELPAMIGIQPMGCDAYLASVSSALQAKIRGPFTNVRRRGLFVDGSIDVQLMNHFILLY